MTCQKSDFPFSHEFTPELILDTSKPEVKQALVELVRLLARRSARKWYQEQMEGQHRPNGLAPNAPRGGPLSRLPTPQSQSGRHSYSPDAHSSRTDSEDDPKRRRKGRVRNGSPKNESSAQPGFQQSQQPSCSVPHGYARTDRLPRLRIRLPERCVGDNIGV